MNLQVQTHAPPPPEKANATTINRALVFMIISFKGKTLNNPLITTVAAFLNANYDDVNLIALNMTWKYFVMESSCRD